MLWRLRLYGERKSPPWGRRTFFGADRTWGLGAGGAAEVNLSGDLSWHPPPAPPAGASMPYLSPDKADTCLRGGSPLGRSGICPRLCCQAAGRLTHLRTRRLFFCLLGGRRQKTCSDESLIAGSKTHSSRLASHWSRSAHTSCLALWEWFFWAAPKQKPRPCGD
jgi:hypothetical protein